MKRFISFLAFLFLAVLAAGVFGMVHDQISYTFSHEYFTKFKFIQFNLLDDQVPERIRAAQVGFLASWWMGIPLGLLTGVVGFIHPNNKQMRNALLISLPIIICFTLVLALAGLAYGFSQTTNLNLNNYASWFIPNNLEHPRNFICVGYMHNSAYLGGVLSIPIAWVFHFFYRRRSATGLTLHSSGSPTATR